MQNNSKLVLFTVNLEFSVFWHISNRSRPFYFSKFYYDKNFSFKFKFKFYSLRSKLGREGLILEEFSKMTWRPLGKISRAQSYWKFFLSGAISEKWNQSPLHHPFNICFHSHYHCGKSVEIQYFLVRIFRYLDIFNSL